MSQTSIPRPLPPGEEGEIHRTRTRRPYRQLTFARAMRKNLTEAEKILWEYLRHDRLGVRFRRQFMCAGSIFDFYCPRHRLVIEIDGENHRSRMHTINDHARDVVFLREFGIQTIRFSNDEVLTNLEAVLAAIKKQICTPPPREEGVGVEVGKKSRKKVLASIFCLLCVLFLSGCAPIERQQARVRAWWAELTGTASGAIATTRATVEGTVEAGRAAAELGAQVMSGAKATVQDLQERAEKVQEGARKIQEGKRLIEEGMGK